MQDEEKKYSVIGTVQIGTDEYRDLIEGLANAKRELSEQTSRRYNEWRRADNAETKVKELTKENEVIRGFINSSEEIKTKYKLYLIEKQTEKNSNE